jgi:hypothetical protein
MQRFHFGSVVVPPAYITGSGLTRSHQQFVSGEVRLLSPSFLFSPSRVLSDLPKYHTNNAPPNLSHVSSPPPCSAAAAVPRLSVGAARRLNPSPADTPHAKSSPPTPLPSVHRGVLALSAPSAASGIGVPGTGLLSSTHS